MIKRIVAGLVTTALTGTVVGVLTHDTAEAGTKQIERSYSVVCKKGQRSCADVCVAALDASGVPGAIVKATYNRRNKQANCSVILPPGFYNNVKLANPGVKLRELTP